MEAREKRTWLIGTASGYVYTVMAATEEEARQIFAMNNPEATIVSVALESDIFGAKEQPQEPQKPSWPPAYASQLTTMPDSEKQILEPVIMNDAKGLCQYYRDCEVPLSSVEREILKTAAMLRGTWHRPSPRSLWEKEVCTMLGYSVPPPRTMYEIMQQKPECMQQSFASWRKLRWP